jgi:hypothetical protein
VFKAGALSQLNMLAWNNKIRLRAYVLLVSERGVMIDRDGRGCQNSAARGEIHGFAED